MYGRDILFKHGVDQATAGRGAAAGRAAALALGVIVAAAAVRVLSRIVIFNGGRAAEYELRSALLARLHTLGAGFFRKIPTGDILSRSTSDLAQLRLLLGFGVLNVINTVFALTSALLVMVGVSVKLTVASLAATPAVVLLTRWFSKQMFVSTRETQEALGRMSDRVQASLAGVRVVRSLALEDAEIDRFRVTSEAYLQKSLRLARIRGSMGPIFGLVGAIGTLIMFWYGGLLMVEGTISRGDFVAFWSALGRLVWPLIALGFILGIVQRGRASYARLQAIYEAIPDVVDGTQPAPEHVEGALQVTNLSVTYGTRTVLDHVTFTVPAGTSLAIVGRTGSGKSTLAAMLPRLLATPAKTVFLDGHDICDLPLLAVRRAIGYAQQDAFLFSTTVLHNVALSLDNTSPEETMRRVRVATREAFIEEEIDALPAGFDTVVGERGVQLSGGQRQRIALARAFLWGPKVLVLDDPLSAVDARTEAAILTAIDRQAAERTLLLITHRIAAAARCDRVIVLDEGRIVEAGTHDELLRGGSLYATFAEEQQRRDSRPAVEPAA